VLRGKSPRSVCDGHLGDELNTRESKEKKAAKGGLEASHQNGIADEVPNGKQANMKILGIPEKKRNLLRGKRPDPKERF